MNIPGTNEMCERVNVKATVPTVAAWLTAATLVASGFAASAQTTNGSSGSNAVPATQAAPARAEVTPPSVTNPPARTESSPPRSDESAFRIISERNIFNANRSGGRVQLATRRATRVETFTLVGTMSYEKGAFAFFEGSSSEFSKVLRAEGVIAGHKLVDVLTDGVKLEADGKQFELPIGSAMRREDAGAWLVATASGGSGGGGDYSPSRDDERNGESGSRNSRSSRGGDSGSRYSRSSSSETPPQSGADKQERKELKKEMKLDAKAESDILKRLMERREKE